MSAAASGRALLSAQGLEKRFGKQTALEGLTLKLEPNELYGLVGPDGAGKTTALRLFAGLLAPNAGSLQVLGEPPLGASTTLRNSLGYMPQQYSLYGDLSIDENLRFFARMFGLSRARFRARRERLLELTRLADFGARRADALSGGMYKKLALACSLLPEPSLLLLDEPTNGVDPVSRRELWQLLFELCGEGTAVLISTAYMDEASRCHRVGLLHEGQLVAEGPPKKLLEDFQETVLLLEATDEATAQAAEELLEPLAEVLALARTANTLRALLRDESARAIRRRLAEALPELRCRAVAPDFEEVFLALTSSTSDVPREVAA